MLFLRFTEGVGTGVPIHEKRLAALVEFDFATPRNFQGELVVAATVDSDPLSLSGNLSLVSPVEPVCACLIAIERSMDASDEESLLKWRQCIMSAPFLFKRLDNDDDRHWYHVQCRERIVQHYVSLRFTALQKMCDVIEFMDRKEKSVGKLSVAKIASAYKENVKFAQGVPEDETSASTTFIETTIAIKERMLSIPSVKKLIFEWDGETTLANPFDSTAKLHVIISKVTLVG